MNSPAENIKQQALEMGADAVGIAAVSEFHRHAPEGHRPDDILKGAKSVIAIGKRRYTTGQWLSSNIDTVHRARSGQGGRNAVGMAIASLIEKDHGCASLMISPGMFDTGLVPVMSLKLPAELAGLGTRGVRAVGPGEGDVGLVERRRFVGPAFGEAFDFTLDRPGDVGSAYH